MSKIIVVGSSNTDMVIKCSQLPAPGETVLGGTFLMNAGGKGANQAVAVARLGADIWFIAKVGNDIFGQEAILQFKNEGIKTPYVFTDPEAPSGVALINVDAHGENAITVASGANARLSMTEIDTAQGIFDADDILLAQLETPIETIAHAFEIAQSKRLKCILNPAPAAQLPAEVFKNLFLITPNETEAELLTGIKVTDEGSAKTAAQYLQAKGVQNVVITLGSKGAYLNSNDFEGLIPTTKIKAIDTTAAGDCFNGAIAVAISEGMSLSEAVSFACKAASISVTRMGAQASMPKREELLM
jgi:ribokinase